MEGRKESLGAGEGRKEPLGAVEGRKWPLGAVEGRKGPLGAVEGRAFPILGREGTLEQRKGWRLGRSIRVEGWSMHIIQSKGGISPFPPHIYMWGGNHP